MKAPYSYHTDPAVPAFDDAGPIAFMDADCALCSHGARMIHWLDRQDAFRICPVQTQLGHAILHHYNMSAEDPESWLILDQGRMYSDLDALAYLGRRTGGWGHFLRIVLIFPKPLRDWMYTRVARNRYALFGRGDMCALPDPAFQRRLMRD
ncbi:thiol-disulfide oxidoreductase DCC family protein [Algirhabdus cladophorae]|uniref:thiol-disulfide oxidoreductase DCC family protein n=1 Tax=Algirhabdus cladophorae TaxID=3377108 RepID=UPI003B8468FA